MGRFEGRFAGSRWGTVSGIPGVPVAEDEKTSKPSFEHLRTLLMALSLIAYVITQLSDKHPTQSKVLLGFTLFLFAANYYPWLNRQIARWVEHRRDDAVARNAFPKFREFVHRFGGFIDSRMNDTLHAIVLQEIVQRRADANVGFKLPNMDTWHSWWLYFWQGIDRQPRTMTELHAALMEFHSLVGTYTNICVTQIFEYLPANVRAEIPPEAKSSLNSFQQRYERFLGEYSQFAKSLSESRPALNGLPCWFSTPKPLS
ncbi:MAG: hypothetical protein DMF60_14140 [Acidobacteria bacterium]|nr:MAG: hypothetical protein DMF60_14140 [Acidobacteriota bacterium]